MAWKDQKQDKTSKYGEHNISRRLTVTEKPFHEVTMLNPLTHGRFSKPYFKLFWEGVNFFSSCVHQKVLQGQEFSGMGSVMIFWVEGKKPRQGGGAYSAPPPGLRA